MDIKMAAKYNQHLTKTVNFYADFENYAQSITQRAN